MKTEKSAFSKIRLPVSPVRILLYLCFYLGNILLYRFFYSYLHLALWVLTSILPFLSGILLHLLLRSLKISISRGEAIHTGEPGTAVLQIQNPSLGLTLRGQILITVSNSFYGSEGKVELSTAIPAKKKKIIEFPIMPDLCGNVEIKIERILIWDILGLVCKKKETDAWTSFLVLPKRADTEEGDWEFPQIAGGITENESSSKKGQDYSDISGIREYVLGDRVKDIHWKLSAKKDVMLVKERVSMSDEQLVIVPEFSGAAQETEQVLAALYGVLLAVTDTTEVKVCWWDTAQGDFSSFRVREEREIGEVFLRIYQTGKYGEIPIKTYMKQMLKEVRVYLYICGNGGHAGMEILANE